MRRIERASKDYVMEISGKKTKLMTTDVQIAGNNLDKVQSFNT